MDCLGNRLKQRREELGLTQEELAQKLGYRSKTTINKIESGTNDITRKKIKTFSEVLDVSEAWLMGYDVPMDSKLTPDQAWDIDAEKFSDEFYYFQIKEDAFLHQLKVMGWTCKHIDSMQDAENGDSYYSFKKGGASFQITWEDYNTFIEDSEKFFNTRLEKLYEKSKKVLFPQTDKSYLEPLAAHRRTDIDAKDITEEMKQNDMDIMNDPDF